jgi:hypothetical protein
MSEPMKQRKRQSVSRSDGMVNYERGFSSRSRPVKRLSILSTLILVVLFAIAFALLARLGDEAFFYITGPVLGALLGASAYRRDRSALITGAVAGGLCQGVIAVMVLKRGYIFPDIAMITGPLFLANLAAHLMAGLAFGTLLYLALRWARPRSALGSPDD